VEVITGVITLQMIFSKYWEAFKKWYTGTIRAAVISNVEKILKCRTGQLGFHAYKCPKCKEVKLVPHSCKSRFCSSCGKIATDRWISERLSDILPVEYHHLVFTLPWQLRIVCLANRKVMFDILFNAVNKSIQSWTRKYGKYIPGFYIVLHTFGSDIKFNPHFHVLITAGGLRLDKKKWKSAPDNFLMPEAGLKKRWRFNVINGIIMANNENKLRMPILSKTNELLNIRGVVSVISKLCWYIFIGTRLTEAGISIKYIGRYTKRPVIAETRILNVSNRWVIFKFKDYAVGGKSSIKKMGLFTFIKYLIQHIPDKNFRLVRGYGLFANCVKGRFCKKVLRLLKKRKQRRKKQKTWRNNYKKLTGRDPLICNKCHVEMEFWFARYGPDKRVFKHFGLNVLERIPIKQFALKTA
jgi:hypothetical protein